MSNYVLVIDTNLKPLTPCKPGTARRLLNACKAAVYRRFPFTIVLLIAVEGNAKPCEQKIDPGSKTTGFALLKGDSVIWAAELSHRGQAIRQALANRRTQRSSRRNRKTRYRPARFLNRAKPKGWLAPSLLHRVRTILTWVKRLSRYCAIDRLAQELVRFKRGRW